ncbi:WhiB family transcriptional regulator [Ornithinimicrobium sp. W1665]|uniref:WhiB family transcriptional regulator n=1 Tax=Ornithinimicrobium sp. W1665 TaxID=3416666 RepID=UPI003CE9363C
MASRPWPSLRPETAEWEAFAVALAEHGTTPCRGGEAWTHEDPGPRRAAALACRACPLAELCHEAAESTHEPWGVFGGIDRTPKAGRPPNTERKTA